ncbi:hypothetical protein M408DRAFT_22356 [Serendipita vermifera MAFF 305830]|uniref:Uncharacterized protein n=1 Tax=Serendipita vermifera MAFF 305830 TaxID=933852 RepID=A0A0C3BCM7_SERVB|nr:hypothetical protein M408DRAFT_22356 [Serendipita vermifera MAFF 305830]
MATQNLTAISSNGHYDLPDQATAHLYEALLHDQSLTYSFDASKLSAPVGIAPALTVGQFLPSEHEKSSNEPNMHPEIPKGALELSIAPKLLRYPSILVFLLRATNFEESIRALIAVRYMIENPAHETVNSKTSVLCRINAQASAAVVEMDAAKLIALRSSGVGI